MLYHSVLCRMLTSSNNSHSPVHKLLLHFSSSSSWLLNFLRQPAHQTMLRRVQALTWPNNFTHTSLQSQVAGPQHQQMQWTSGYRTSIRLASKFFRFESSWLQYVKTIARKDVWNRPTHNWSGQTKTAIENEVGQIGSLSLQQPFFSVVVDSSRSVMRAFYTCSCNVFHVLLSTGFKLGETYQFW